MDPLRFADNLEGKVLEGCADGFERKVWTCLVVCLHELRHAREAAAICFQTRWTVALTQMLSAFNVAVLAAQYGGKLIRTNEDIIRMGSEQLAFSAVILKFYKAKDAIGALTYKYKDLDIGHDIDPKDDDFIHVRALIEEACGIVGDTFTWRADELQYHAEPGWVEIPDGKE